MDCRSEACRLNGTDAVVFAFGVAAPSRIATPSDDLWKEEDWDDEDWGDEDEWEDEDDEDWGDEDEWEDEDDEWDDENDEWELPF